MKQTPRRDAGARRRRGWITPRLAPKRSGGLALIIAIGIGAPLPARAAPLPPSDLQIITSGDAGDLARIDLDAGLEPEAAELAIRRGRERLRADNAAVHYLQAMLLLPERSEKLLSVNGTADRFQRLAGEDFASGLRSTEVDTLLRAALQCQGCDFQVNTAGGAATPLPHLREATWLVEFMGICADYDLARGKPWSALRRYGDMRAVSRDIAGGVGFVSTLTGMKLEALQQERLLQALPRLLKAGVPAGTIEALSAHEERQAPTVRSAFAADSLFEDSLRRALRRLDDGRLDLFWAQLDELYGLRGTGSLRETAVLHQALREEELDDPQALASFAAGELRAYVRHVDRLVLLAEKPVAERREGLRTLHEELVADLSQGILTRRFAPVLPSFVREIEKNKRKICALHVLLAACAERERAGVFPGDLAALRAARPEVCAKDHLNGGELEYSVRKGSITIAWDDEGQDVKREMTMTWPTE